MTTGVDLKDDLSRFQIVVKMPFSSLGDPRTKKKSEINSDWYTCQMLKNLVQACGRSTRSAEDHSATFILDSSFRYWVTKYEKWLPKQFLQRIKGFD
jgi:Rad3-related DNA helicase